MMVAGFPATIEWSGTSLVTTLPAVLAKAFHIAKTGRPGPVLIDITKNAQIQKIEYSGYTKCDFIRSYRPKPIIRTEYIKEAAEIINSAKKPFVIWGTGLHMTGPPSRKQAPAGFNLQKAHLPISFLLYNPQLRIIQHDLLLSVVLENHRSDRVVRSTFHSRYFSKTKFLMLNALSGLKI